MVPVSISDGGLSREGGCAGPNENRRVHEVQEVSCGLLLSFNVSPDWSRGVKRDIETSASGKAGGVGAKSVIVRANEKIGYPQSVCNRNCGSE
jgi:hypothetical protein